MRCWMKILQINCRNLPCEIWPSKFSVPIYWSDNDICFARFYRCWWLRRCSSLKNRPTTDNKFYWIRSGSVGMGMGESMWKRLPSNWLTFDRSVSFRFSSHWNNRKPPNNISKSRQKRWFWCGIVGNIFVWVCSIGFATESDWNWNCVCSSFVPLHSQT